MASHGLPWHDMVCDCATCQAADAALLADPEMQALLREAGPGPCEGCEKPGTLPINGKPDAPRVCDDCWAGPRSGGCE
jgi:hypothetical protein